jgi:hypothetical protein
MKQNWYHVDLSSLGLHRTRRLVRAIADQNAFLTAALQATQWLRS